MDFRAIKSQPEWERAFDRFVCVEMIENVGREFIPEYWEVVDWTMKDTAVGVVQCITMPESRKLTFYLCNDPSVQQILCFQGYRPTMKLVSISFKNGSVERCTCFRHLRLLIPSARISTFLE